VSTKRQITGLTCLFCRVRFRKTKIDRFEYTPTRSEKAEGWRNESYCSEACSHENGWNTTNDTEEESAEVVAKLLAAVKAQPPDRAFSREERQSLNDTLAIVRFESGAERNAGAPMTLPMLQAALEKLGDGLNFRDETLDQLEDTLRVLRPVRSAEATARFVM
jgi:hypothetical protein